MNLTHPDSPDVKAALETKCRHCGVPIVPQWWHGTHNHLEYRACRNTDGRMTGQTHAEPEVHE